LIVPCTRLVITAGAWSPKVFNDLFPSAKIKIPVTPLAGHSLVMKSPRWTTEQEEQGCHAIFAEGSIGFSPGSSHQIDDEKATNTLGFSPEMFSRLGEEIYLTGLNSTTIPLPAVATDAKVQPAAIKQMKEVAAKLIGVSDSPDDLVVVREALVGSARLHCLLYTDLFQCFRPVTTSGRPIISKIEDEDLGGGFSTRKGGEGGVFIAAGHATWGEFESLTDAQ
jgi:glycine/D-amino acid oxidase-like deaminating enzyme